MTLGYAVRGFLGAVQLSAKKSAELISLGVFALLERQPRPKLLLVVGGKVMPGLQLQRPALAAVNDLWLVGPAKVPALQRAEAVRDELWLLLALLPKHYLDMRTPTSGLVSASDASELGGGVCVSAGLWCLRSSTTWSS